jgi:NTP pyrophosphatase (non-canonical NTP hydrolase)
MENEVEPQSMIVKTRKLIAEFKKREQKEWGAEGSMIELMKQVGDLSKCVMVYEKYYLKERELDPKYKTIKDNIGDELYDIFFMTVRLADHYGIDLEQECDKEYNYSMDYFRKENTEAQ